MATSQLTNSSASKLQSRNKTYTVYDGKLAGFGCRVSAGGIKSWIVEYRPGGGGRRIAKRRLTLGRITALTAEQARRAAKEVLARVSLGEDVVGKRLERRNAPTVLELARRYMEEEVSRTCKPNTVTLYEGYFRLHLLPELGSKRAIDVHRSDVVRLHRELGATKPATANRVLIMFSGLFAWARSVELIPDDLNPCKGISKFKEQGRERFLSREEFARIGDALREAETIGLPWEPDCTKLTAKHAPKPENRRQVISPFVTASIRLLILTGCRLREILNLRWNEVDFERGILFLPDSKTGRKPVILGSAAIDILSALPRIGQCVVPGNNPDAPRHDLQRPWAAICKRAGLQGLRIHDLRHSFAATGAAGNFGLPVLGKLLGHRNVETTARYAHLAEHPLRVAADRIANELASAIAPRQRQLQVQADTRDRSSVDNATHDAMLVD